MERLGCKETGPPLKSQRPGPLNDPSENLHVSGALASTAWSCKYGTFDKGPSFGSRLELVPSKLPQAQVLVRDVLRKEESVQGTPVLQNYGAQRVAAATLLQAENNINAAKLLPPACLGCFGLRPSPWCPKRRQRGTPFWRLLGDRRHLNWVSLGLLLSGCFHSGAGSYPGGFLERNFDALLQRVHQKGLATRRPPSQRPARDWSHKNPQTGRRPTYLQSPPLFG